MSEHTKLPWRISKEQGGENGIQDKAGRYVCFSALPYKIEEEQKDGESWRDMMTRLEPKQRERDAAQEANAEFIVRACNSHYELLELLERVVAVSDGTTVWHDDAQAAIAKAKEGKA